jgi:hypothetical protein
MATIRRELGAQSGGGDFLHMKGDDWFEMMLAEYFSIAFIISSAPYGG